MTGELTLAGDAAVSAAASAECPLNHGLPALDLGDKPVSFFEFWPTWLMYIPVVAQWLLLALRYGNAGLPMLVNPRIPFGGMIGESKVDILNMAGPTARPYILPFVVAEQREIPPLENRDVFFTRWADNVLSRAQAQGITLPFVAKPEFGCRGAGVQLVESRAALIGYLRDFPAESRIIVQQLAPYAAEAGVFYERMPGEPFGRVTSITLKYRPYVIGDGASSLQSLIMQHPRARRRHRLYFELNAAQLTRVPATNDVVPLAFAGSHCRGSIFRNGNHLMSRALSEKIDAIMRDFPEFHYGRLDIKFKNTACLQAGTDLVIIEVNGVSSEKTHIWDSRTTLRQALATLLEQYATLFRMGKRMQALGHRPPSARRLVGTWLAGLLGSANK